MSTVRWSGGGLDDYIHFTFNVVIVQYTIAVAST